MFIETFILDGYNRMLQILGDLIQCDRQTVGIGCCQFTDLIALVIIQKCGITQGHNINIINIRSIINHTSEGTNSQTGYSDAESDQ